MPCEIPLSQIDDNPWQSRTVYEAEALGELADDIRRHGLLQPPVGRIVNPKGVILSPDDWSAKHAVMYPHSLATIMDGSGENRPSEANGARVQVALAYCSVTDEVREGELRRRLGELEAGDAGSNVR